MNTLAKLTIASLATFQIASSYSQTGTVQTISGTTREVKNYSVGAGSFDIDMTAVDGWEKCTVSPVKVLELNGKKKMRIDMFCSTTQGHMANFSCSTEKGNREVATPQITSSGSKLNSRSIIESTSYMNITLSCEYLK